MLNLEQLFHFIGTLYIQITYFIYDTFKLPYVLVLALLVITCAVILLRTHFLIQNEKTKTLHFTFGNILSLIIAINLIITVGASLTLDKSPIAKNTFVGKKLHTKKVSTSTTVLSKTQVLKYANVSGTLTYVDNTKTIQKRQIHINHYKLIDKKDSPKITFTQSEYSYTTPYRNIENFIIAPNDNTTSFGDGEPQNYFDKSSRHWIQISNVTMYVSKSDYQKYTE